MGSITSTKALLAAALLAALSACASSPPPAFLPPLDRVAVSSEFGERRGIRRRPHYGMDLRARRGTPVTASAAGRVIFRGQKRGFGNIVILEHSGDITTYYAHLSDFAVRSGQPVEIGQTIGFVGATGNATGPHLHFELRRGGEPVDPRGWVAF